MFNKYRELGLALIPLIPGTKRPSEANWQQFCDRLPTEAECDAWEMRDPCAYGVALGPSSGILALDIDSDDPKILAAAPPSPVRKRGRKGETRFFRYDREVPSCKVAGCIDVLSHGRQTVVPPTLHPDTGEAYVWLTPDTLEDFDLLDLPNFSSSDLEDLRRALGEATETVISESGVSLQGPFTNDDPKRLSPHGSHDRLKRIANALISRGASPDEAVRELIRYDEENHLPVGYFADSTRPDCFADPLSNALYFYSSNLRTFNRRQVRSGQAPVVPLVSGSEILDVSMVSMDLPKAFKQSEWPEPKGLLKDMKDLISEFSIRSQPSLAIGGALALASVSIANRAKMGQVWPNLYVLNVAPTGSGKSFPYTVIKRIFSPENGIDLMGAGGYRSSSAMIKDLMGRRERLDLIDECSGMFRMIRDGGVFQQDMMDILNSLWSDSHSIFLGPDSVGRERVSVWNPCVSVLFSTTPDGFKTSVSREFVVQGFLPRCLIFHDSEYGELKGSVWNDALYQKVVKGIQSIQSMGKGEAPGARNYVSPKPNPDEIPISNAAKKRLTDYDRECAERLASSDREEIERHFLSRASQQAARLALIHGTLRGRLVDEDDVEWAIGTLSASWHNSSTLLPQAGAENTQETNVMRVYQIIRKEGSIPHSKLIGKTRFLKTAERHEILTSLETEGKIRSIINDNRAKVWHIF